MASKNRFWLTTLASSIIFILLAFGCTNDDDSNISRKSIDRLNWSERNYQVLNQLIDDYGIGGKYYNNKEIPYAVLDWDQTCAHFDVGEALMRYQLTNFCFKLSKEQFTTLLKDEINGISQLSESFQNISLKNINADLIEEYSFIYDHFIGTGGTMNLMEIQATPQYQDFRAKLPFLYDGYCDTDAIGDEYAYTWVIYLLAGYTIDEVKTLAREAISFELANDLGKKEWSSPPSYKTHSGVINYSYKSGLRILSEMQNLIETFQKNGIDVFIVSASYKPIVEVFSASGNFGYQIPTEKVIGMELAVNSEGIIIPEYKAGWVKTVGQGKIEAINSIIKAQLGKNTDPIFAAGDSDGDYEMLSGFKDMKLALVWNRLKGGKIGSLCQLAVDEMNDETPRYILQGRDENIGMAIPTSSSILLGKTEARLLP